MTTREALCALLVSILLITAGAVWMFGPYGLFGGGVVLLVLTLLTDKHEPHEEKEDDGDG